MVIMSRMFIHWRREDISSGNSRDLFRGVHAHSCIMGNKGKMAGNSKICIGIQSQLILPKFIYLMLSL